MNIKQAIGNRIKNSRKEIGITIKELAERTKTLSAARISNWEQGTRTPGPVEAKVLADILNVAPSYLLCLSDDQRGDLCIQTELLPRYLPLLPLSDVNLTRPKLQKIIKNISLFSEDTAKVSFEDKTTLNAGPNAFAALVEDTSMSPDFKPGDTIIADPDKQPNPGQYVIAHIKNAGENIIRKYRELDNKVAAKHSFELMALNQDWRTIQINSNKDGTIIATLIEHRRLL